MGGSLCWWHGANRSPSSRHGRLVWKVTGSIFDVLKKSNPCAVWHNSIQSSQCKLCVHKGCSGINGDGLLPQTISAPVVRAMLDPLLAEQWLKWLSVAPCWCGGHFLLLRWYAVLPLVVAVIVSLLADDSWPRESTEDCCVSTPAGISHARCAAKCVTPASTPLCYAKAKHVDWAPQTYSCSASVTAPWSAGSVSPKIMTKHHRIRFSKNSALSLRLRC